MASRTQKEYMMVCALVIGCMKTMGENYTPESGHSELCEDIQKLKESAQSAFDLAHGSLDPDEIRELVKGVGEMQKVGLEGADSCQTLLSMLIGIISDKLTEIKATSPKHKALGGILEQIEAMYAKVEEDEKYDRQGLVLLNTFTEVFN